MFNRGFDAMIEDAARQVVGATKLAMDFTAGGIDILRDHRNRQKKVYDPPVLEEEFFETTAQRLKRGKEPLVIPKLDWKQSQLFTITLPQSTEWDARRALALTKQLLTLENFVLRISGEQGQIRWQLVSLRNQISESFVRATIQAHYPSAKVEVAPLVGQGAKLQLPIYRMVVRYRYAHPTFAAPIAQVDEIGKLDPLIALSNTIGDLQAGERVTYTLVVASPTRQAAEAGWKDITQSNVRSRDFTSVGTAIAAASRKMKNQDRTARYETDLQKPMEAKLAEQLFHCLLLIQIDTQSEERMGALLSAALQMQQYDKTRFNALLPLFDKEEVSHITDAAQAGRTNTWSLLNRWLTNEDKSWQDVLLVLSPDEIASLWHLPHAHFTARDVDFIPGKQVPIPRQLRGQTTGVRIGVNRSANHEDEVYIPPSERETHVAVVGKTGSGKSTLLHNLIRQDIAAGHGVAVIDPLGKLVRRILQQSIPPDRENDVVVLDISYEFEEEGKSVRYPPPMNLLAKVPGVNDDVAAGMVVEVLSKIYADDFATTQMAHTLRMALMTLAPDPTPTLLDVDRLFDDDVYRTQLLDAIDNFALTRFWDRMVDRRGVKDLVDPVLRRLDAFYANPLLLPITCHPDRLDIGSLIGENKIILVSLQADEAKVPEVERMVLGSTIVSQIQMAAMAGAVKKRPYLFYIDEVHHFTTTSLPRMLSQARNHGLGMYVANQYFNQIAGETLDALMGNVGTLIAFEVDDADARKIGQVMHGFDASDIVHIGKHRAAVSMRDAYGNRHAFSLDTQDIPEREDQSEAHERERYLRRKSVENYTPKSYSEIKVWLDKRYKSPAPPAKGQKAEPDDDEFIEPRR